MEKTRLVLKRLGAFPARYAQILRVTGSYETSRLACLGALFWFFMFSGIWLVMLAELVAGWFGSSIPLMPAELGPIALGDFVLSTFFTSLMVFVTGNFLYGRFAMSRADVEAMVETWSDVNSFAYAAIGPDSYWGRRIRFAFQMAGVVCLLMIMAVLVRVVAE